MPHEWLQVKFTESPLLCLEVFCIVIERLVLPPPHNRAKNHGSAGNYYRGGVPAQVFFATRRDRQEKGARIQNGKFLAF